MASTRADALGAPGGWIWAARPERSDRALVRAARGGSAAAAEALARRYWDEVRHVAFLIVRDPAAAEDVAQEAIVAALGGLERFDRRRAFRPWVHRIAANRAIDWARASGRRGEVGIDEADDLAAIAGPADGGTPQGALGTALAELDPEARALIALRYVLDYRAREIGPMFGLGPGAVRTRLHRALAHLRERLEDEEER